jgi:hypothetical protein
MQATESPQLAACTRSCRRESVKLGDVFGKILEQQDMGGIGSGRRFQGGQDTTSNYLSLDLRYLQREGLLTPGRSCNLTWTRLGRTEGAIGLQAEPDRLILNYRYQSHGGDWRSTEYPVQLDWTPCTFGGRRPWLLCPKALYRPTLTVRLGYR